MSVHGDWQHFAVLWTTRPAKADANQRGNRARQALP
jgi:hypothetical protein